MTPMMRTIGAIAGVCAAPPPAVCGTGQDPGGDAAVRAWGASVT